LRETRVEGERHAQRQKCCSVQRVVSRAVHSHRSRHRSVGVARQRSIHRPLRFETDRGGRLAVDWARGAGTEESAQHRFAAERRAGGERNAAVQRAQVAQGGWIKAYRKRLIENGQEIWIIVDAILEGAVRMEDLNEDCLASALSIRPHARIPSTRRKANDASFPDDGQAFGARVRHARHRGARIDAVEILSRGIVQEIGKGRSRHKDECGNEGDCELDCELRFLRGRLYSTVSLAARASLGVLAATERRGASFEEEADVGRTLADDDRLGVGEAAPVNVNDEVPGGEAGKRAMDAAREFVVWSARADHLTDGEFQQLADAHRRRKREGARAADCDGMEVERNLHADHRTSNFCRIEELPAAGDK